MKEVNELKTRIKKLEEESQRQAQMPSIQFPAIRMAIRLDIIDSGSPDTSFPVVGLWIAQKGIQATGSKRKKTTKQERLYESKKQSFSGLPNFSERKTFVLVS